MKRLCVAAVCLLPAAGAAQPVDGPYTGFGTGYAVPNGDMTPSTSSRSPLAQTLGHDRAETFKGSVGEGFGNGFRVEMEGDYARKPY